MRAPLRALALGITAAAALACNQLLGSATADTVVPDDAAAGAPGDAGGGGDAAATASDAGVDGRAPDGGCLPGFDECAPGSCVDVTSNRAHCGSCTNACLGPCVDAACSGDVVMGGLTSPAAVIADATRVYWTSNGAPGATGAGLYHLGPNGNAELVPTGGSTTAGYDEGLSFDTGPSTDVFVAENAPTRDVARYGAGSVGQLTIGGPTPPQEIRYVAVDGMRAFFTDPVSGAVYSQTKNGGTGPSLIRIVSGVGASNQGPWAIAVSGGTAYFTVRGDCAGTVPGSVLSSPVLGGGTKTVSASASCPLALAIADGFVYWTEHGTDAAPTTGALRRASLANGTPGDVVTGRRGPRGLAVDGNDVYWVEDGTPPDYADGEVLHLVIGAAGPPDVVASKQRRPVSVAVTTSRIYWLTADALLSAPRR